MDPLSDEDNVLEELVKTLGRQITGSGWVEAELARKRAAGEPLVNILTVDEATIVGGGGGGGDGGGGAELASSGASAGTFSAAGAGAGGVAAAAAPAAPAKTEWPELVGADADAAVQRIRAEQPTFAVHKVPEDSMVTMDFREDRVRVFVAAGNRVSTAPRCG